MMRESYAELDGIIKDTHYAERVKQWDPERWRVFQPLVDKVIKLVGNTATGLDLGAGEGFFTKCCQENGLRVTALEGSTVAVEYGRKALGINIERYNLKDHFLFADNSMDFITYHDVYEHVPQYINENVFRESFRILRPKGIFWVITICKYDFVESSELEHINNPTPTELYRLGKRMGFSATICCPPLNISLFTGKFYDKELNCKPWKKRMRNFIKKNYKPIAFALSPFWLSLWYLNARLLHIDFLDFVSGKSNVIFRKP
jgi:SAM-dependent methyltransferase